MQYVCPPSGDTAENLPLQGLTHSHMNDVRLFPEHHYRPGKQGV